MSNLSVLLPAHVSANTAFDVEVDVSNPSHIHRAWYKFFKGTTTPHFPPPNPWAAWPLTQVGPAKEFKPPTKVGIVWKLTDTLTLGAGDYIFVAWVIDSDLPQTVMATLITPLSIPNATSKPLAARAAARAGKQKPRDKAR